MQIEGTAQRPLMTATTGKRGPKRSAVTAFLARAEAIRADLDGGWKMIAIYEKHASQLGIGYPQFTRYVHTHIWKRPKKPKRLSLATAPAADRLPNAPALAPQAPPRDGPIVTSSSTPRRFVFDPTAAHRKKLV